MNKFLEWLQCAGARAIRTFAQVALSMVTVGQAFTDINWIHIISIAATSAAISLLMAAANMPEYAKDGTLHIDTNGLDKDVYQLAMEKELPALKSAKRVVLTVNPKAKIVDGKVVS